MQILRTFLVAAVAAAQIAHSSRSDPVLVQAVAAGDAVTIQSVGRVRLLGIKAPAEATPAAEPIAADLRN